MSVDYGDGTLLFQTWNKIRNSLKFKIKKKQIVYDEIINIDENKYFPPESIFDL